MTSKFLLVATLFIASCAISTGARALNTLKKKTVAGRHEQQPALPGPAYAEREDVMLAAEDIAARRNLDLAWVRQAIGQARYSAQAVKFMQPPRVGTVKNWRLYRSRFIDAVRINAGVKFWQENRATLARAELESGVPAEIIVGVIGVETIYGQQMGSFRVLDALATLSLDFPAEHPRFEERRKFFRSELAHFLKLKPHTGLDPTAWRGSYAGAMGIPQFMPSSWLRFAVDFDGDGKIDLFRSTADAIGSVAHYFKAFNWQSGMPTHYAVAFDAAKLDKDALLAPDILPTFDVASFTAKGALLDEAGQAHKGRLALIELHNGTGEPQYVAGTDNFYAITRYNWSSYYAMAMIELGQAVAQARRGAKASNGDQANR